MVAGLVFAVVALAGVVVFYQGHHRTTPKQATPVSQDASAPPDDDGPSLPERDRRFLFLLATHGIESSGSSATIDDAHVVCAHYAGGEREDQIIQDIIDGSPGMSKDDATTFADAAINVYCPQG